MEKENSKMSDYILPVSVKIGYRHYVIEHWKGRVGIQAGRFGECDTSLAIIRVDDGWSKEKAANTLLHEIMHAIFFEYNMCDEDDEERIVCTMSNALITVMTDNPIVSLYIFGENK